MPNPFAGHRPLVLTARHSLGGMNETYRSSYGALDQTWLFCGVELFVR